MTIKEYLVKNRRDNLDNGVAPEVSGTILEPPSPAHELPPTTKLIIVFIFLPWTTEKNAIAQTNHLGFTNLCSQSGRQAFQPQRSENGITSSFSESGAFLFSSRRPSAMTETIKWSIQKVAT